MKKLICCFLALFLFAGTMNLAAFAEGAGPNGVYEINRYEGETIAHISDGYSYGRYLARVFSVGIGEGSVQYIPEGEGVLTRAEAIAIAARLHSFYFGGDLKYEESNPWFKVYLDYGHEYGIIPTGQTQLNSGITRMEFASLLSKAIPDEALDTICSIMDGSLYDVNLGDPCAEGVYRLCRAGIFTDVDEKGNFRPGEIVLRSDVDDIITRIAVPNMRSAYDLKAYVGSTAPMQPLADDDFFSDACIIGNSLVEGIRYFSKLKTLTYYSGTGMSVISANNKYDFFSRKGTYETAVGAAAAGDFSKVYIELGINEIGYSVDTFIGYYSNIIDRLQAALPEADIYILSLTPVSKRKDSGGTFTMARINAYNEGLKRLAIEKSCYYIDCVSSMVDETGFLPSRDTWDGVHFQVSKYAEWEEIIRTHYAN